MRENETENNKKSKNSGARSLQHGGYGFWCLCSVFVCLCDAWMYDLLKFMTTGAHT